MRCWHDNLSAERCSWFAYGPAEATATPSSLGLTFLLQAYWGCSAKEAIKRVSVCSSDQSYIFFVQLRIQPVMSQPEFLHFTQLLFNRKTIIKQSEEVDHFWHGFLKKKGTFSETSVRPIMISDIGIGHIGINPRYRRSEATAHRYPMCVIWSVRSTTH